MDIPLKHLETENRRLQGRLRSLTVEAEKNEAIFRRFQLLELQLLTAESLVALLDNAVVGAMSSLGLDDVTLVLHDPDHEVRYLLSRSGIAAGAPPGVVFADHLVQCSPIYARLRQPWLGPLLPEHAQLFARPSALASVAIVPLISQGCLFGSLNFGSVNADRYTRHHATDFHSRLAIVTAVCLENAINRERLVISGLTDILTGWHNRRYLQRRLPEEVARARRYRQPLSALLLDVDHFKRVNDRHGHPAGDCVLRDVATRIRQELRSTDLAVRYGGEEFAAVLPQTTLADAVQTAERIRRTVAERPFVTDQGQPLPVTLSAGVSELSLYDAQSESEALGEELLARADAALYRAKAEGRNRVVCGD
jgi:two-component system cell cycle response regulator